MASTQTGNISDILDDIGLSFVTSDVPLKKKQNGFFVTGSYISSVKIFRESQDITTMSGKVYPTQRKRDSEHRVDFQFDKKRRMLVYSHCTIHILWHAMLKWILHVLCLPFKINVVELNVCFKHTQSIISLSGI